MPDELDGARLLDSGQAALADWPELGSRPRLSVDEWNRLTADEQRAYQNIGIAAIDRAVGWKQVVDQCRPHTHRAVARMSDRADPGSHRSTEDGSSVDLGR